MHRHLERGDSVAICMRNRSEWMIGFWRRSAAAASAALLNSRGSPSELCAAIDDVSPAVVLADSGARGVAARGRLHRPG